MKFREHRGGLQESLDTQVEVANFDELFHHLRHVLSEILGAPYELRKQCIIIRYYGYDERTEEELHIVTIEGYGVIGFLNGF